MKTALSLLAFAVAGVEAIEGSCHALSLSGGANNGAWEAGVLWGLVNYGNPADYQWDVVTGVSAGAINSGAIIMFAPGDEIAMTQYLSDTWRSIDSADIWLPRGGGKAGLMYSMFNEPSLLDDSPLVPTLTSIIEPFRSTGILRNFALAAVDANTGDYHIWDNSNVTFDTVPQSAASSGSIPGAFFPQQMDGLVLMDGGTMWNINIDSGVQYCLDQGYTQEQIILDMVICGTEPTLNEQVYGSAMKNWFDARAIHKSYNQLNALQAELDAYPNIDVRFMFQETSTGCPPYSELDFSDATTWCLQEAGRTDAQTMLGLGQSNVKATFKEYMGSKEARKEFPKFRDFLNNKFDI